MYAHIWLHERQSYYVCKCINLGGLASLSMIKSKFYRLQWRDETKEWNEIGLDVKSYTEVKKINCLGASLVAQWLRICLPMQGTWVRALVWEDPTCHGPTGPVSHNYWACASGACAPQQERPRQWEARAPRWRVAPARRNWRKPSHRNEDPTHPKKSINQ